MSKKRAPKTAARLQDADASADQTADLRPTGATDDAAVSPLNHVTSSVQNGASVEAAPDATESARQPKGEKSTGGKKDKAAKVAKAAEGDKKEKRGKKHKKEKAAKAVKASKQDRDAKRDKPRGKKDKSTVASDLRPLRKVNVLLIEPNGQPRAHFDGEIGVLDLLLPKAEGDDSRR